MQATLLEYSLFLPRTREEVFPFFAEAKNLETITPNWLSFSIVRQSPGEMKAGTLIDYRLKLRGIPFRWRTEITAWEPPARFEDTQIRGPYRLWVHEHRFVEENRGTLMVDRIRYAVWGGKLVAKLLVNRDVEKIFAFRREKLLQIFESAS